MLRGSIRTSVRSHGLVKKSRFGQRHISRKANEFLHISEEIRCAVASGKPVVALETTIYTHGFPFPENATLALHLESVVRKNGAIPATIGVLNGIARIGFKPKELTELAMSAGKPDTMKLSRRDLGYICGLGLTNRRLIGGTTIAGTMVLADLAGITMVATGGLGGVHRGGENTMDISADLTELGRTPVTVICSGCKSFLDIPRTLEYLETEGVFVGTFADGREGRVGFPAFWTRDSLVPSPAVIKDEKQAAAIIYAQRAFPIKSGIFLANPIPPEYSLEKTYMDGIIAQALHDASESGSSGSDNTPYVLKRIRELTGGSTVTANSALVEANVLRGTRLAVELADLECLQGRMPRNHDGSSSTSKKTTVTTDTASVSYASSRSIFHPQHISSSNNTSNASRSSVVAKVLSDAASQQTLVDDSTKSLTATTSEDPSIIGKADTFTTAPQTSQALSLPDDTEIIVAGSLAIDLSCDYAPEIPHGLRIPQRSTSNPAVITQFLGGVGQNVATTIHYLGCPVRLCSLVGDDPAGSVAMFELKKRGLQTVGIMKKEGRSTAQYVAVNDSRKDLVLAMADMTIFEHPPTLDSTESLRQFQSQWQAHSDAPKLKWIIIDANWDPSSIRKWIVGGRLKRAKIAFEPVSAVKSTRIFGTKGEPFSAHPPFIVDLATPNLIELNSMHAAAKRMGWFRDDWKKMIDAMGIPKGSLVEGRTIHQAIELLPYIPTILIKLGDQGVLMNQLLHPGDDRLTSKYSEPYIPYRSSGKNDLVGGVYVRLFPSVEKVPENEMISVNGVGDTFLGVLMAGLVKEHPKNLEDLIDIAQRGSVMTLKSKESVSPQVSTLRSEL